ncbi:MAG: hypothetical protein ABEJ98_04630 [Candidatus Nanohaloarchaea archaeon]
MNTVKADVSEGNFDFKRWTNKVGRVVEELEELGFTYQHGTGYSKEDHIEHLRDIHRPESENTLTGYGSPRPIDQEGEHEDISVALNVENVEEDSEGQVYEADIKHVVLARGQFGYGAVGEDIYPEEWRVTGSIGDGEPLLMNDKDSTVVFSAPYDQRGDFTVQFDSAKAEDFVENLLEKETNAGVQPDYIQEQLRESVQEKVDGEVYVDEHFAVNVSYDQRPEKIAQEVVSAYNALRETLDYDRIGDF